MMRKVFFLNNKSTLYYYDANKARMHNTYTVLISKPYTTTSFYSRTRNLVQAGIEVRPGVLAEITFFAKARNLVAV